MGKIFLSEFKQKLNKKQIKLSIKVSQTKIDFEDFANRRNQTFISYLSKYLTDNRIRKGITKINPYTVKFDSFSLIIDEDISKVFNNFLASPPQELIINVLHSLVILILSLDNLK